MDEAFAGMEFGGVDDEIADPVMSEEEKLKASMNVSIWNLGECMAAIRGQRMPKRGMGLLVTRQCVVRGIRHHDGFGVELHGLDPLFTRALNARKIMSNIIPEQIKADEVPYCIWYPDVASQDTYRKLVEQYPDMTYQVGRACAVAGFVDLYKELDILPEVHIAEEARENKTGGREIYELIMSSPCRYKVMDDYNLTVNLINPQAPAQLNGDTAVRALLDIKQKPRKDWTATHPPRHFNITEDMSLDEHDTNDFPSSEYSGAYPITYSTLPLDPIRTPLLYTPLPFDLPTIQKDLLILMAAHAGDIDRYARLRRPHLIRHERECIVHGIYHSTPFARWWATRRVPDTPGQALWHIRAAITARYIMANDLSRVPATQNATDLPYTIWHPVVPQRETLAALAKLEPRMALSAARACIVGGYRELFAALDPDADVYLRIEARASGDAFFDEFLARKSAASDATEVQGAQGWERYTVVQAREMDARPACLVRHPGPEDVDTAFEGVYDGLSCDVSRVLGACLPEEWTLEEGGGIVSVTERYGRLVWDG